MQRQSTFARIVLLGLATVVGSQHAVAFGADRSARPSGRRSSGKRKKIDVRDRITVLKKGTSTKKARLAAEKMVGGVKMTRSHAIRVSRILDDTSYFRELPTLRFEVDPRAYFHFSEHPDLTVGLWRAMGISKFRVSKTAADKYAADSGDGTKGTIEVVERNPSHKVILCSGVFKSPFLPKGIQTHSVIHLQTRFSRDKTGKTFATHRGFVHVSFPSTTVETAAKLLSPVGNSVLDRNFQEISLFLHVMSLAMARQPGWVERIAARLDSATDDQKKDLMKVTARVYKTARSRGTIPLYKTREEYLRELKRPVKSARRDDRRMSRR